MRTHARAQEFLKVLKFPKVLSSCAIYTRADGESDFKTVNLAHVFEFRLGQFAAKIARHEEERVPIARVRKLAMRRITAMLRVRMSKIA